MNPNDDPQAMRSYINRQYAVERGKYGSTSPLERRLWQFAMDAPYGAKVIATDDDPRIPNPYLMRVYLTPERKELAKLLVDLKLPMVVAKLALLSPRPYLHYFFRGDDDRAYHNHPWKESASFILTKGYREHRWDFTKLQENSRVVLPGQFNFIGRGAFHKVELLPEGGCWTVFVSGRPMDLPEGKDWDFYDPKKDKFTPWAEWIASQDRLKQRMAEPLSEPWKMAEPWPGSARGQG